MHLVQSHLHENPTYGRQRTVPSAVLFLVSPFPPFPPLSPRTHGSKVRSGTYTKHVRIFPKFHALRRVSFARGTCLLFLFTLLWRITYFPSPPQFSSRAWLVTRCLWDTNDAWNFWNVKIRWIGSGALFEILGWFRRTVSEEEARSCSRVVHC